MGELYNLSGSLIAPETLKGKINPLYTYHTDAYMIAVKNGFEGTEEEWLEYLRANEVDAIEIVTVDEKYEMRMYLRDGTQRTAEFTIPTDKSMAPAGYGLGESSRYIDSFENIDKCGFYFSNAGTPDADWWCCCAVVVDNGSQVLLDAWNRSGTSNCKRAKLENTWGEWEWVNPPMQLGVEYRTTERYQRRPVYVKLINFGEVPSNSYKSINLVFGISDLVDAKGIVADGMNQSMTPLAYNGNIAISVTDGYYLGVSTTGSFLEDYLIVELKYTK